jgi:hypothetical protein
MPVTLYSSTGALRFSPSRLLFRPVLVGSDCLALSDEPDEIVPPPRGAPVADRATRLRARFLALLLFAVLQAAALAPPLYITRVFPG